MQPKEIVRVNKLDKMRRVGAEEEMVDWDEAIGNGGDSGPKGEDWIEKGRQRKP